MNDDKARQPDPITVTLTREEAEALGGKAYPLAACRSGQAKLREAVYSEARPTITEEAVERGAKAILAVEQAGQVAEDWYVGLSRACLQAALGGSDE